MWWHGDRENALEHLERHGLRVPAAPDELRGVLQPKDLLVRRDFDAARPWIAEFNFHAAFDIEHGVGILTDGDLILGIGYSADASRFK